MKNYEVDSSRLVMFDLIEETFICKEISDEFYETDKFYGIDVQLLLAINKKIVELGWIKNENDE